MAKVKLFDENHHVVGSTELSNDGTIVATSDQLGNIKLGSLFKLNSSNQLTTKDPSNSSQGILKGKCEGTSSSQFPTTDYCVAKLWYHISEDRFKVAIPRATDSALGVVKVGTGLSIDSSGNLNASASSPTEIEIQKSGDTFVLTDNTITSSAILDGSGKLKNFYFKHDGQDFYYTPSMAEGGSSGVKVWFLETMSYPDSEPVPVYNYVTIPWAQAN